MGITRREIEERAYAKPSPSQELNDRPSKRLAFKKPIELIGDLLLR